MKIFFASPLVAIGLIWSTSAMGLIYFQGTATGREKHAFDTVRYHLPSAEKQMQNELAALRQKCSSQYHGILATFGDSAYTEGDDDVVSCRYECTGEPGVDNGTATAPTSAASTSSPTGAASRKSRIETLFDASKAPSIDELPSDASWKGFCLLDGNFQHRRAFLLNFVKVPDSVLGDASFVLPLLSEASVKRYDSMSPGDADKLREELQSKELEYFNELFPASAALQSRMEAPAGHGWLVEERRSDPLALQLLLNLRVSHRSGKGPIYFLQIVCDAEGGCSLTSGAPRVNRGETVAYCYADAPIALPAAPTVTKPSTPAQPPPVASPKPLPPQAPAPQPSVPAGAEVITVRPEAGVLD